MIGKIVPQNVAKAMPSSTRLLNRKLLSRDRNESSSFLLLRSGRRFKISPTQNSTITPRKARKKYPRVASSNVCTDWIKPLRVMNVPKMVMT